MFNAMFMVVIIGVGIMAILAFGILRFFLALIQGGFRHPVVRRTFVGLGICGAVLAVWTILFFIPALEAVNATGS
jgi:hypothetical protein